MHNIARVDRCICIRLRILEQKAELTACVLFPSIKNHDVSGWEVAIPNLHRVAIVKKCLEFVYELLQRLWAEYKPSFFELYWYLTALPKLGYFVVFKRHVAQWI